MRSIALLLLGLLAAADPPPQSPATRLYVRTVPTGANVLLDGREIGKSDGLFPVAAGTRTLVVELDGYLPDERRVEIAADEITRVELQLKKQPQVPGKTSVTVQPSNAGIGVENKGDADAKAATTYMTDANLATPVRDAILTVLRQHPDESRWSGREGKTLFAVVVKRLPEGKISQRTTPATLELTHMLCVHELLKAKSLLDQYAATGLIDATTLREAVVNAAGKLDVTGKMTGAVYQAALRGDFAIAYVLAEEPAMTAHLLQPVELEIVRTAYRDVMHRQAQRLMKQSNWRDALLLWQHLHKRKLVSQQLYLDAASCFKETGQVQDAIRVLTEAIDTFGKGGPPEFLEAAGDIALAIGTQGGESLAETAYGMASKQLMDTISPSKPQPTDGNQPR